MFRPYEYWKHDSALDTALHIIHEQYHGTDYVKVKAQLVGIRNSIVYETKTYTIQRNELSLWKCWGTLK